MALHSGKDSSSPPADRSEGGGGSVVKNVRREFSARTKREAWSRANGFCEGLLCRACGVYFKSSFEPCHGCGNPPRGGHLKRCNAPLDRGNFHYDHDCPDWFSKDNELENCRVLCHLCHKAKTKIDITAIAKSKRIIDKRIKARKKRGGFRGWRKFDGTPVYARKAKQ